MNLLERINWISEHMEEPKLLVSGEEFDQVKEALEKQIPKKPDFKEVEFYEDKLSIPICPLCGEQIINHGYGWICMNSKCRQAIDYEGRKARQ